MWDERDDRLVHSRIAYCVEYEGRIVIVENVPARIGPETGDRFYSPETVEQLQSIVWSGGQPDRIAQTPVFHPAA